MLSPNHPNYDKLMEFKNSKDWRKRIAFIISINTEEEEYYCLSFKDDDDTNEFYTHIKEIKELLNIPQVQSEEEITKPSQNKDLLKAIDMLHKGKAVYVNYKGYKEHLAHIVCDNEQLMDILFNDSRKYITIKLYEHRHNYPELYNVVDIKIEDFKLWKEDQDQTDNTEQEQDELAKESEKNDLTKKIVQLSKSFEYLSQHNDSLFKTMAGVEYKIITHTDQIKGLKEKVAKLEELNSKNFNSLEFDGIKNQELVEQDKLCPICGKKLTTNNDLVFRPAGNYEDSIMYSCKCGYFKHGKIEKINGKEVLKPNEHKYFYVSAIKDQEEYEIVQKICFALGYFWNAGRSLTNYDIKDIGFYTGYCNHLTRVWSDDEIKEIPPERQYTPEQFIAMGEYLKKQGIIKF